VVVAEAVLLHDELDLVDEDGQVALRLGHGEAAGREGDAGRRGVPEARVIDVVELVLGKERLHLGQALLRDLGQDQVLVGRQAEDALVDLGDLAQARLEAEPGLVLDAAVLDEHREVVLAVVALGPAEVVDVVDKLERPRRRELLAEALLNLLDKRRQAEPVDRVLQPRVLAVRTVAVVALGEDDGLRNLEALVRGDEADDVGQARVRLGVRVGDAHAAADGDVEADQLLVLVVDDGDEAEVVRKDVDVVAGKKSGQEGQRRASGESGRRRRDESAGEQRLTGVGRRSTS
jgi:hypothetical protein